MAMPNIDSYTTDNPGNDYITATEFLNSNYGQSLNKYYAIDEISTDSFYREICILIDKCCSELNGITGYKFDTLYRDSESITSDDENYIEAQAIIKELKFGVIIFVYYYFTSNDKSTPQGSASVSFGGLSMSENFPTDRALPQELIAILKKYKLIDTGVASSAKDQTTGTLLSDILYGLPGTNLSLLTAWLDNRYLKATGGIYGTDPIIVNEGGSNNQRYYGIKLSPDYVPPIDWTSGISTDPNNILVAGSDSKLYVPEQDSPPIDWGNELSIDDWNLLSIGTDSKLLLHPDAIGNVMAGAYIQYDTTNHQFYLPDRPGFYGYGPGATNNASVSSCYFYNRISDSSQEVELQVVVWNSWLQKAFPMKIGDKGYSTISNNVNDYTNDYYATVGMVKNAISTFDWTSGISTDPNNVLVAGSDSKLFVSQSLVDWTSGISADSANLLTTGTDSKLFINTDIIGTAIVDNKNLVFDSNSHKIELAANIAGISTSGYGNSDSNLTDLGVSTSAVVYSTSRALEFISYDSSGQVDEPPRVRLKGPEENFSQDHNSTTYTDFTITTVGMLKNAITNFAWNAGISTDPNNVLVAGTDLKLFVPVSQAAVEPNYTRVYISRITHKLVNGTNYLNIKDRLHLSFDWTMVSEIGIEIYKYINGSSYIVTENIILPTKGLLQNKIVSVLNEIHLYKSLFYMEGTGSDPTPLDIWYDTSTIFNGCALLSSQLTTISDIYERVYVQIDSNKIDKFINGVGTYAKANLNDMYGVRYATETDSDFFNVAVESATILKQDKNNLSPKK